MALSGTSVPDPIAPLKGAVQAAPQLGPFSPAHPQQERVGARKGLPGSSRKPPLFLGLVAAECCAQNRPILGRRKGSRLLVLQDHPPEEKVSEDESQFVLKLLHETLKH